MKRQNGTKTRSFGAGVRENHDSSAYYERELMPIGVEALIDPPAQADKPLPDAARDRFFHKSSASMDDLPPRCVHLMVTSPPYNVGKDYDDDLSMEEYLELIETVMGESYRVLVDGGRACVNVANIGRKPYIPLHAYVIQKAAKVGFFMRGEIIWDKGMSGTSTAWGSWRSPSNPILRDSHEYILIFQKPPFGRAASDGNRFTIERDTFLQGTKSIWHIPPASASDAEHPAPFPIELPRRLIELYTFPGDVVLDPFMGTGATALAAHGSNRTFVGYDVEERYVEISKLRLKEYGMISEFERIAESHYENLAQGFDDESLSTYFADCFAEAISLFNLYPASVCMKCAAEGEFPVMYGPKPKRCVECNSGQVYQIGSFQARASVVGETFQTAVRVLFERSFGLTLTKTPPNIATHNLQAPPDVAVEAKGSPNIISLPGGINHRLPRAGMLRTDTQKKTHGNARQYKSANPSGAFYVLSNALPPSWDRSNSDDVDGYYDVTRAESVREFAVAVAELQSPTPQNSAA